MASVDRRAAYSSRLSIWVGLWWSMLCAVPESAKEECRDDFCGVVRFWRDGEGVMERGEPWFCSAMSGGLVLCRPLADSLALISSAGACGGGAPSVITARDGCCWMAPFSSRSMSCWRLTADTAFSISSVFASACMAVESGLARGMAVAVSSVSM